MYKSTESTVSYRNSAPYELNNINRVLCYLKAAVNIAFFQILCCVTCHYKINITHNGLTLSRHSLKTDASKGPEHWENSLQLMWLLSSLVCHQSFKTTPTKKPYNPHWRESVSRESV